MQKNIKEFFQNIRERQKTIKALGEKLRTFRELASYGTGEKETTGKSGINQSSRIEDYVCKLVDLERELMKWDCWLDENGKIHDISADLQTAKSLIERLPTKEQEVMTRYYFKLHKWNSIASGMNITLRYVFKLHGQALKTLSKNW